MNLYQHQKEIIDADPKKTGLFLGTGSGKTRIALNLARGTVLIIAPKTQVEDKNWERELKNVKEYPIIIKVISKETFRRDWEKLDAFDTVIVDEAHTCLGVTANVRWRNKQPIPKASQLFEALQAYLERVNPERLYLCTATIIRSPMTVWAAGKLLGKKWDWYEWRNIFYVRLPMPGREVFAPRNDSDTKDRLAAAVRKIGYTGQLSDYFDVPDQTYKVDYVELSAKQKHRIKELPLEYPDPLVLIGKKHQVENGVLSGDEFNKPQFFPNEKIDKIIDYAAEFPRMIVFAKYTNQITQIAEALEEAGKKVFRLTGDTVQRGSLLRTVNNTDEYVFIVQAQVSAGWELPDCPVMIFASMSFSVVDRIQAEGRILRANKLKKNLYIDLVIRGGIDAAVYKSIQNKQDFQERIYINQYAI